MFHMGRKYGIEHLTKDATRYLEKWYPHRFSYYQKRWESHRIIEMEGVEEGMDSIMVINLAKDFDLPNILPVAFYRCAQLSIDQIFTGFTDSTGKSWTLSEDDIRRISMGREEMRERRLRQLSILVSPFSLKTAGDCATPETCLGEMKDLGHASLSYWSTRLKRAILTPIQPHLEDYNVCHLCTTMLVHSYDQHRHTLWSSLVKVFKLEDMVDENRWQEEEE